MSCTSRPGTAAVRTRDSRAPHCEKPLAGSTDVIAAGTVNAPVSAVSQRSTYHSAPAWQMLAQFTCKRMRSRTLAT